MKSNLCERSLESCRYPVPNLRKVYHGAKLFRSIPLSFSPKKVCLKKQAICFTFFTFPRFPFPSYLFLISVFPFLTSFSKHLPPSRHPSPVTSLVSYKNLALVISWELMTWKPATHSTKSEKNRYSTRPSAPMLHRLFQTGEQCRKRLSKKQYQLIGVYSNSVNNFKFVVENSTAFDHPKTVTITYGARAKQPKPF